MATIYDRDHALIFIDGKKLRNVVPAAQKKRRYAGFSTIVGLRFGILQHSCRATVDGEDHRPLGRADVLRGSAEWLRKLILDWISLVMAIGGTVQITGLGIIKPARQPRPTIQPSGRLAPGHVAP